MNDEISQLSVAVNNTPDDVKTRPGEGLGVPSPGFKALGREEMLVSGAAALANEGVGGRGVGLNKSHRPQDLEGFWECTHSGSRQSELAEGPTGWRCSTQAACMRCKDASSLCMQLEYPCNVVTASPAGPALLHCRHSVHTT
jgi:hypothetical protein